MGTTRALSDKLAISLSVLCTFHCLALPSLLVLMPSFFANTLGSEAFHLWMILLVIPVSLYAMTLGCQQHKKTAVLFACGLGLLLLLAALFGEDHFGELGEKLLTTLGSACLFFGHLLNYRLCQKKADENCGCGSEKLVSE